MFIQKQLVKKISGSIDLNRKNVLLRERGSISDIWNVLFVICLMGMTVESVLYFKELGLDFNIVINEEHLLFWGEIIICLIFIVGIWMKGKWITRVALVGETAVGTISIWLILTKSQSVYYMIHFSLLFLIAGTYFVLRYRLDINWPTLNKMWKRVIKFIVGEDAVNISEDNFTKN